MKKFTMKKVWLVLLTLALVFGLGITMVGCGEDPPPPPPEFPILFSAGQWCDEVGDVEQKNCTIVGDDLVPDDDNITVYFENNIDASKYKTLEVTFTGASDWFGGGFAFSDAKTEQQIWAGFDNGAGKVTIKLADFDDVDFKELRGLILGGNQPYKASIIELKE